MPEKRLARTRENYRCGRGMVIVPWPHCDCRNCQMARDIPRQYREAMLSRDDDGWNYAFSGCKTPPLGCKIESA